MTIQTGRTAVKASALLAVIALSGGAFATAGISESFESAAVGDTAATANAKLAGNGEVASGGAATAPGMGYPIAGATHDKALEIAGTVTYTEGSAPASTGSSQVDFMFKVEPTDELEAPSGDDVQIALAVGTNDVGTTTAPIKLWCKTASDSGSAGWVTLGSAVETGSWVRATIVLDYGDKKCSVSLNGDPALNGSSKWFYFANNGSQNYVSTITMVGSTLLDDLVVSHTALDSYTPAGGNQTVAAGSSGVAVSYDYINKYGVTTNQVANNSTLGAGMTVAEKYVAGLDPKSDTKFEMKTMTPTSATSAKVTFPGNNTSGYTVTVSENSDGSSPLSTVTTGFGNEGTTAAGETINSATVTLPADKAKLYIRVKATK